MPAKQTPSPHILLILLVVLAVATAIAREDPVGAGDLATLVLAVSEAVSRTGRDPR